jgi:hypothetical protein
MVKADIGAGADLSSCARCRARRGFGADARLLLGACNAQPFPSRAGIRPEVV